MHLKSIPTSHGAACLIDLTAPPIHPMDIPADWGAILWGRCDRVSALTVALTISSATWIADYTPNRLAAIVVWSRDGDIPIGTEITFDSTLARDAICPKCGSSIYTLNGAAGYRCKDCGRQWKPDAKPRGGARSGAGRKSVNMLDF
jgi:DNA-directed RNA polymerase subunit RPC12/RpoP